MKEFAFGTEEQYNWLENLISDGQCHVFNNCVLPSSCTPDHARLTNRQLTEISTEKGKEAEQQQIYGHAVDLTASLEDIVGENALKDAYFGGNMQGLETKVDSLVGPNEFGHLRDCLDRSISDNYAERVVATREAQEILARMAERNKVS